MRSTIQKMLECKGLDLAHAVAHERMLAAGMNPRRVHEQLIKTGSFPPEAKKRYAPPNYKKLPFTRAYARRLAGITAKKDPVPPVHWNIYPLCTGREWQRPSMDFASEKNHPNWKKDVTCRSCRKKLGLPPL